MPFEKVLAAFGCIKSDPIGRIGGLDDGGGGDVGAVANAEEPYVVPPDGVCTAPASNGNFKYAMGYTPDPTVRQTVQTLLSKMTLADKATQMRGMPYGAAGTLNFTDVQRSPNTKTIRGFRYRDASRGINLSEDMEGAIPNA